MTNQSPRIISETSPTVQVHLGILQGVIDRMAANSSSSKTWCITVVSAILVVVADKNRPAFAMLAFIPTFLFCVVDVYYLGLERGFRKSYDDFVQRTHSGTLNSSDLFSVRPLGSMWRHQLDAAQSFSVWAFYLVLAILILLAWKVMLLPPGQ